MPAWPSGLGGLTSLQVAQQRLLGFNDIMAPTVRGWLGVVKDTARDPMLWFLVVTAGLFALLGQVSESLTLFAAMVPLMGMDAYLHRRTNASIAGLASRLANSARVLRDGHWQDIASRDLVAGDLVEVKPGEYFPADGLLVSGTGLQVDESTLTGESLPVAKHLMEATTPPPATVSEAHWPTPIQP